MLFDGLAALDAYRASSANDTARLARISKINESLGRPQSASLFEVLATAAPATRPAYVQRVNLSPALGKAGELRKLLEERVKQPLKGSIGTSLSTEVAPEKGANFVILNLFANLAGMEEARNANQSDPSWAAFQSRLAGILLEPARQELLAILVPYPAAAR